MYDERQITELVDKYSNTVFHICYQYIRNYHDAEDITQDVFVSIMKKDFSSFDEKAIRAYIIRSAINKCRTFHKNIQKLSVIPLDEAEPLLTNEEESILDDVMSLPAKYRDVLYLFYYEGLTISEIADILQRSIGTVSSRLKRAREKLKVVLTEDNDER